MQEPVSTKIAAFGRHLLFFTGRSCTLLALSCLLMLTHLPLDLQAKSQKARKARRAPSSEANGTGGAGNSQFDTSDLAPGVGSAESAVNELSLDDGADGAISSGSADGAGDSSGGVVMDEETLRKRLLSFSYLIKAARAPEEKAQFLLSRCLLHLRRGKALSSLPAEEKNPLVVTDLKKAYDLAAKDALEVTKLKKIYVKTMSYAYYLHGLALAGGGSAELAILSLEKAVKLKPNAKYAGSVALFVAETYYRSGDYLKAIQSLKSAMPSMSDAHKARAQYWIARSYAGRDDFSMAEINLMALLKNEHLGDLKKVIVRELGAVSSRFRDEAGLLSLSHQLFGMDNDRKAEFLSSAYSAMQRESSGRRGQSLFKTLVKLASTPEKRVKLLIGEMETSRRNFASRASMGNFQAILRELQKLPEKQMIDVIKSVESELLVEVESLMKSYVNTYSQRAPNPESIMRMDMANGLKTLFAFQEKYFPTAKSRKQVLSLWLNVCSEQKDADCVREVSNKVLGSRGLASIHASANEEKIIALRNLASKDPKKYMQELRDTLVAYTRDLKAPKYVQFANFLADLEVQAGNFDKALPLLLDLDTKRQTKDSFYRLFAARFLAGQYKTVFEARPPLGEDTSQRWQNLQRNASLKLGTGETAPNPNSPEYRETLRVFFAAGAGEK